MVLDQGWDLLAFARQASGIAAGNIAFDTVPTQGIETNARGSVVRVDPGQVRAFVERRSAEQEQAAQRAREAAETPAPTTFEPPPPLDIEAGHYVVHVRNGSGTSGLAGQVQQRLTGLGFVRGTVDNTADTPTSVVRHRDSPDAADAVAAQLGGFEVEQDDTVASGHLQVVLGADAPTLMPGLPARPRHRRRPPRRRPNSRSPPRAYRASPRYVLWIDAAAEQGEDLQVESLIDDRSEEAP